MIEFLLSELLENINGHRCRLGVAVPDRLFSYSFADGKIESDMIIYIYIYIFWLRKKEQKWAIQICRL